MHLQLKDATSVRVLLARGLALLSLMALLNEAKQIVEYLKTQVQLGVAETSAEFQDSMKKAKEDCLNRMHLKPKSSPKPYQYTNRQGTCS